jgi:hypothetical protein
VAVIRKEGGKNMLNGRDLKFFTVGVLMVASSLSVLAAVNLTSFAPNTVIKSSEVNANFAALNNSKQDRVTGTCPTGSSINAVNADGTVTCQSANGAGVVHAVSARRTTLLSVNNAFFTKVGFDAEFFDTGNLHDNANNNTRLTAPVAGVYQVSAGLTWLPNPNGVRTLRVIKNGTAVALLDSRTAALGENISQSTTGLLQLAAGDFIEVQVVQTSGATLGLSTAEPLKFEMVWVAPVV